MTSKTTQAGSRRVAPLARALVFVLLAFVTHSATIEIVHQHGNMLAANSTGAARSFDVNTDHSTTESSRSTSECLICQLHQHLFSTLLIGLPGVALSQTEEATVAQSFVSCPSQAQTPQRGRAPPQTSLL